MASSGEQGTTIELLSNLPKRGVLLDNTNVFSVRNAVSPYLALGPQKAPKQQTISTEENSEVRGFIVLWSTRYPLLVSRVRSFLMHLHNCLQAFIRMLQRRGPQAQQRAPPSAKRPHAESSKQQAAGKASGGGDTEAGPVAKKAKLSKAFAAVAGKAATLSTAASEGADQGGARGTGGRSAAAAEPGEGGPGPSTGDAQGTTQAPGSSKAAAPTSSKPQGDGSAKPATAAPGARPAAAALVAAVQGPGTGARVAGAPSSSSRFTVYPQEELTRKQLKDLKVEPWLHALQLCTADLHVCVLAVWFVTAPVYMRCSTAATMHGANPHLPPSEYVGLIFMSASAHMYYGMQELCKQRSLAVSGTKDALVQRIVEYQRRMKRASEASGA
jgi:hypothetical protein